MAKWFVSEGHPDHGIVDEQGVLVAMVTTDEDSPQEPEQVLANAKLIAAAPELLRGCQAAAAYLIDPASKHASNRQEAAKIILDAIAKAEGRDE